MNMSIMGSNVRGERQGRQERKGQKIALGSSRRLAFAASEILMFPVTRDGSVDLSWHLKKTVWLGV